MRKGTLLLILGLVSSSLGIGGFTYYWTPTAGDTVTRNRLKYNYDSIRVWAGRASDTINSKVNPVYYKRGDILIDTLNATKAIIDTSKTRSARSTRLQADSAFITSNMNIGSATRDSMVTISGGLHVKGGVKVDLLSGTIDSARAAGTATKLTTARTIGGVSFNGTANIVPDTAKSSKYTTQLQTARTIGGTSFDGTASIVPDSSKNTRNLTGGNALADSVNVHGTIISKAGKVGVLSTSPDSTLTVTGSTNLNGNVRISGVTLINSSDFSVGGNSKGRTWISYLGAPYYGSVLSLCYDRGADMGAFRIVGRNSSTTYGALAIERPTSSIAYGANPSTLTYAEVLRIDSAGKMGIGTTVPDSLLTVSGSFHSTGNARIDGVTYHGGNVRLNSNYISYDAAASKGLSFDNGNIAYITGTTSNIGDARIMLALTDDNAFAAGVGGGITFRGKYKVDNSVATFAGIKGIKANATDDNSSGQLHFQTRLNGNNPATRMMIDENGKVGIGNTAPARLLDVNGTAKANYFITASLDSFAYNDTTFPCTLKTMTGDTAKDQGTVRAIVIGDKITLAFPSSSLSSPTPLAGAFLYIKINPSILWPTSIRCMPVVGSSGALAYVKMNTNGKLEIYDAAGAAFGGLYLGNVINFVK
jgi:hypothetical protein